MDMNKISIVLIVFSAMAFSIGFILGFQFVQAYDKNIDYKIELFNQYQGTIRVYTRDTVRVMPIDSLVYYIDKDQE